MFLPYSQCELGVVMEEYNFKDVLINLQAQLRYQTKAQRSLKLKTNSKSSISEDVLLFQIKF